MAATRRFGRGGAPKKKTHCSPEIYSDRCADQSFDSRPVASGAPTNQLAAQSHEVCAARGLNSAVSMGLDCHHGCTGWAGREASGRPTGEDKTLASLFVRRQEFFLSSSAVAVPKNPLPVFDDSHGDAKSRLNCNASSGPEPIPVRLVSRRAGAARVGAR